MTENARVSPATRTGFTVLTCHVTYTIDNHMFLARPYTIYINRTDSGKLEIQRSGQFHLRGYIALHIYYFHRYLDSLVHNIYMYCIVYRLVTCTKPQREETPPACRAILSCEAVNSVARRYCLYIYQLGPCTWCMWERKSRRIQREDQAAHSNTNNERVVESKRLSYF